MSRKPTRPASLQQATPGLHQHSGTGPVQTQVNTSPGSPATLQSRTHARPPQAAAELLGGARQPAREIAAISPTPQRPPDVGRAPLPPPGRLVRPCALPARAGPASGVRPPAPPAAAAMLLLWRSRCLGRALGRSVRTLRQVRPGVARPRGGRGAGGRGAWASGLGGAKDTGTRPARPRRRSGVGAPRVARPRC